MPSQVLEVGSRVRERRRQPGHPKSVDASRHAAPSADRRITKTRTALYDALIQLMETRGYDQVSVGDICAAANITRGTFYNHFCDKDALLQSLEDDVIGGLDLLQERLADLTLVDLALKVASKQPLPILVELFDYLREQGAFMHAVLGPGGDGLFGAKLRDAVCTNLVHSILNEKYRTSTDPFVGYYVAFYASAYLGVIERWIATGMVESSQEMALIAQRLLMIKPGESIKL